jgi:hypothetical protein
MQVHHVAFSVLCSSGMLMLDDFDIVWAHNLLEQCGCWHKWGHLFIVE